MKKRLIAALFSVLLIINFVFPFMALAKSPVTVSDGVEIYVYQINENDITSALKEAFSFCDSQENKSFTVKVPEGTYTVSSPITLSNNTTLDLSGVILENGESNSNIFITKRNVTKYNGSKNIKVSGGTLTYSTEYKKKSCLVRMAHADNVTFKNTVFMLNKDSHHVELAACRNITFEGCTFKDGSGNLSNTSGEALQIDILEETTHFPNMPEYDATMNNNITVNNCIFKNLLRGVGTNSGIAGLYHKNIKITNCKFSNIRATAINFMNYIESEISNNTIANCGEGIKYFMMVSDSNLHKMCYIDGKGSPRSDCASVISSNTVSVKKNDYISQSVGIQLRGNDVTKKDVPFKKANYFVGKINVINNKILTEDVGIRMFDTRNSLISNNEITGKSIDNGISLDLDSKSNEISKNTVRSFDKGVYFKSGNNNVLKSNKLENNRYGAYFATGLKAKVYHNKYKNNSKNNCLIAGNKKSYAISNLSKPEISVKKSGKTSVLKWNKIKGAQKYQIYRATSKNAAYTKIATVSSKSLSYKDKNLKKGKRYYYRVRAIRTLNLVGNYSCFSEKVNVKI